MLDFFSASKVFSKYYLNFFKRGFNFRGKTTRKEFCYFAGAATLINLVIYSLFLISYSLLLSEDTENISFIFSDFFLGGQYDSDREKFFFLSRGLLYFHYFVTLIPYLSINIRRLRDSGRKWAWIFINFIPVFGNIIYLVFLFQPSLNDSYKKRIKNKSKKFQKSPSISEELEKLVELRKKGFLTDEEFKAAKGRIIE